MLPPPFIVLPVFFQRGAERKSSSPLSPGRNLWGDWRGAAGWWHGRPASWAPSVSRVLQPPGCEGQSGAGLWVTPALCQRLCSWHSHLFGFLVRWPLGKESVAKRKRKNTRLENYPLDMVLVDHHSWSLHSQRHRDVAELGCPTAAHFYPVPCSPLWAHSQEPGYLCPCGHSSLK